MKIFSNIMVNSFIELLIKDKIIPDESKEIYLYGIYVIVFNLIVVVDILLIGFILNQLKYSIYHLFRRYKNAQKDRH